MTERINKRSSYAGIVLIVTAVVSKLLGAIYRIPLTNILGVEGIGMYQLVFPVYALMLTLSSSGIPTAVSRLVAERLALGDEKGVQSVVVTATILLSILGIFFALIMALVALPLSMLESRENLSIVYFALAPSVLFVSIGAVIRGYFEGSLSMTPTAVKELVSQSVKMGAGLVLSSYFMQYGIVAAVTGAVLGVTISEAVSLIVLIVMYARAPKSKSHIHLEDFREFGRDIVRVSIPLALSGIIFPIVQVIDSILIVEILRWAGVDSARATSLYGLLTGPVNTLVNMPIVVILSISILIVPVVSEGRARHDANYVKSKAFTSIKVAFIIGVPAFFGMFAVAPDIMTILYPALSEGDILLGSWLLRLSSLTIILLSLVEIETSLLTALDKARVGMHALAWGAVAKVVLSVPLIYYLSIEGAAIASMIGYLTIALVDTIFMRRYLGRSASLLRAVAKILLSGLVMLAIILPITHFVANIYVALALALPLGVAIYVAFMLSLRVMDREELLSLPCGKLFVYLDKKMHPRRREDD